MANFTANNSIVFFFLARIMKPPSMRNANHLNKLFFVKLDTICDANNCVTREQAHRNSTSIELITTFGSARAHQMKADTGRLPVTCQLTNITNNQHSNYARIYRFIAWKWKSNLHRIGIASEKWNGLVYSMATQSFLSWCAIHHSAFPITSEYSLNGFVIVTTNYKIICTATRAVAASAANDSH